VLQWIRWRQCSQRFPQASRNFFGHSQLQFPRGPRDGVIRNKRDGHPRRSCQAITAPRQLFMLLQDIPWGWFSPGAAASNAPPVPGPAGTEKLRRRAGGLSAPSCLYFRAKLGQTGVGACCGAVT